MSNPTSDPDAELSWIHTPDDLATSLDTLRRRKGLSLAQLERKSKGWTGDRQELKRSTLSDVFTGKSPVSPTFLTSLLAACEVPPDGRRQWREVWARVSVRRPVGRSRFDAASPRDLGIHSAIVAPDSTDELPTYVLRDFDFRLRTALSLNISDRGCFVVLVGGSSTGKTRSLYEAVYELVPNWWLVLPEETGELLALKHAPPRQTVFWLDELQRYLCRHPPLSSECVRALIRQGNIVVGTLWPDQYDGRIAIRQQETEDAADVRRLLKSATVVSVPDDLTPAERVQAGDVATQDSRIRIALDTRDVGLTQALAGGPDLVLCWEQSPNPYAKAMITAAADGHRLGVQAPLDAELLAEAMFGYLRPAQRVPPKEVWLDEAIVARQRVGALAGGRRSGRNARRLHRRRLPGPAPARRSPDGVRTEGSVVGARQRSEGLRGPAPARGQRRRPAALLLRGTGTPPARRGVR